MNIEMVDLKNQYLKLKNEIDLSISNVINSTKFINGPDVDLFTNSLKKYLNVKHVIPCANGTDALQISFMALNLKKGDEVICPAFTYVATLEILVLLGLKPVLVDVDYKSFNISIDHIKNKITKKTKAIIPVHLFGQSCDMEPILSFAKKYNLFVVEDNAQAFGSNFKFKNGEVKMTGTIGDIGTTSFFPSKNLGCYGDGGAIFTNNTKLYKRIKMICNHGQSKKYYHDILGVNSRLDSIQASILNVKLKYIDDFNNSRIKMAETYNSHFKEISDYIKVPYTFSFSKHIYHQYSILINSNLRDSLKNFLYKNNIPSMIYYPLPLYNQKAFNKLFDSNFELKNTENICKRILSLPIHTEIETSNQNKIIQKVLEFFNNKL